MRIGKESIELLKDLGNLISKLIKFVNELMIIVFMYCFTHRNYNKCIGII